MSYKLVYKTNEATAIFHNKDARVLREIIKRAEDSNIEVEWQLFNEGGIKLDSSEEQKKEKKEKKNGKKGMS